MNKNNTDQKLQYHTLGDDGFLRPIIIDPMGDVNLVEYGVNFIEKQKAEYINLNELKKLILSV